MRILRSAILVLAVVLALLVAGTVVVRHTDVGRERVRRLVLGALRDAVHGRVTFDRLEGDLLGDFALVGLSIGDSAGAPLVTVERLAARLDVGGLLGKRVRVHEVVAIRPQLFLVQGRDGVWNYERIFPRREDAPDDEPGFGDWVALSRARLRDGTLRVRRPWSPPDSLPGAARDSVTQAALAGESRVRVVARPEGLTQVMAFERLDALATEVVIADPDDRDIRLRVDSLAMVAAPFNPPALVIRQLSGDVRIAEDSVGMASLRLQLPASEATGRLTYRLSSGDVESVLDVPRLALDDVRMLHPPLPESGSAAMRLRLVVRERGASEYDVSDATVRIGRSTVRGTLGLVLDDSTTRFRGTALTAERVTTALVESLVPGVESPLRGEFSGHVEVDGPLTGLQLQLDATVAAVGHPAFTVAARGGVGLGDAVTMRNLRVQGDRIPVSLAQSFDVAAPVGGTVDATATLDGSSAGRIRGVARLAHRQDGAVARLRAAGFVQPADGRRFDVRVRVEELPLALADSLLGRDDVQGVLSGDVHARGTPRAMSARFALAVEGGGRVEGDADYRAEAGGGMRPAEYRATLALAGVEPQAVLTSLPDTRFDGTVRLEGRGTDPATLEGRLDARLAPFVIDSADVHDVVVQLRAADGLVQLDSVAAATDFASVRATGDFGLTEARSGTVEFAATVSDLAGLRRWIAPDDTTSVPARPAVGQRMARRRAERDSLLALARQGTDPAALLAAELAAARRAERREARRAARRLASVEVPPVATDSLAGSIELEARAVGNVKGARLTATATSPGVVWGGNVLGATRVLAEWRGALTPDDTMQVDVSADSIRAAGFALDSTRLRATYREGDGDVALTIFPGDTARYQLEADYAVRTGEGELRLRDIALRMDVSDWRSVRPSVISWKGRGLTIDSLELRDAANDGRIFVHGEIPDADPGRVEVVAERVRVAPWLAIAQSDVRADAVASVDATWEGTRRDPRFEGTLRAEQLVHDDVALPDLRARLDYAGRTLTLDARALRDGGQQLAQLTGTVPIDLSLADSVPERLPPEGRLALRLQGDSIPLSPLVELTDAITDAEGAAQGDVRVGGTWDTPSFDGAIRAQLPRARLTATGVELRDLAMVLRMRGDSVLVDTLTARSGGCIDASGSIVIADVANPALAVDVTLRDARVLDDETGELFADGRVRVAGALDTLAVTGNVAVTRGVVYIPEPEQFDIIETTDPAIFAVSDTSTAEALGVGAPSETLRNLRMQVEVEVRRGTFARSPDANVEVYGTLQVEKASGAEEYAVSGALYTDQGDYTFLGKRFDVSRGSVRFVGTEELNPALQIVAIYQVQQAGRAPLDIRVVIGGTLERPTVSLESDAQPTMSQSDLISFLAFGRSSSSLLQFSGTGLEGGGAGGSSLAGNVAALARRQLAAIGLGALVDEVRSELAVATRADVLNITPAQLQADPSLGALQTVLRGTEIEIGKYVDRRTFVIGRIRPTLAVPGATLERRLSDRLRLRTSLETRFLPTPPSLSAGRDPRTLQVLGALLTWTIAW